ncbi:sensor histidine kinase [Thermobifida halotolerans]|uniref:histidine kinase n=1 Tax=Thermobifida halotolerans TaxID=483545 RepID=A0A399G6V9_9ACTN|nr:ATP-binding protein [Thermobifida halotolerans]UOE18611.1 sensor histidine kinase [Thermobifida halotolerans]
MTARKPARAPAGTTPLSVPLLLASVVLVAAGWTWAAWRVPAAHLPPVLVAGGTSLLLLLAFGAGLRHQAVRAARAASHADRTRADAERLTGEAIPAVVERVRAGASAATALDGIDRSVGSVHRSVLETVATEIARSERRRVAAMAACATAAGRVQAITTAMLADLRDMQQRHGNGPPTADVLGDLMHLDHSTAQAGRVADSIAVLTGARSGRRWTRPIPMESVLRGAMARIGDYQRVRTHSASSLAVAGYAAEGVIHALAELLDNAARFSPPTSEVHVYVEEVQAGAAVIVEDGGLVMGEEALRRAREAVSGDTDLSALSGTRLGLAVVGSLARRYGLSVSFRPSSRGGTAAVLLLPQRILKPGDPVTPDLPSPPPAPGRHTPPPETPTAPAGQPPREPAAEGAVRGDSGLPIRRRGQTLAAAQRDRTPPPPTRSAPVTPSEGFKAFRAAVRKAPPHRTQEDRS